MNIKEAQQDMQSSYLGGAPGALVSGSIWIIAGIVAVYSTAQTSLITFFFGGMMIHPLGILLSKSFKRSGKHQEENPLAKLALESTLLLFIGLFIAFAIFQIQSAWFFSIMLLIIGSRYVLFQTIYGMKVYWIFGLVLIVVGVICLISDQAIYMAAILGGVIELVFAFVIIRLEKASMNGNETTS